MKSLDCAICVHAERPLIERMLSRGEALSYLCDRFPGLSVVVFRSHRDDHMDVQDATAFASPKNRLSDLQEARLLVQKMMDICGNAGVAPDGTPIPPRPLLVLNAVNSLRGVLSDMDQTADKVRILEVNDDARVLQTVLREVLARHQDALEDFNSTLQQKLLTVEEE